MVMSIKQRKLQGTYLGEKLTHQLTTLRQRVSYVSGLGAFVGVLGTSS